MEERRRCRNDGGERFGGESAESWNLSGEVRRKDLSGDRSGERSGSRSGDFSGE